MYINVDDTACVMLYCSLEIATWVTKAIINNAAATIMTTPCIILVNLLGEDILSFIPIVPTYILINWYSDIVNLNIDGRYLKSITSHTHLFTL